MDISAVIIFHRERFLVNASLDSFKLCCEDARKRGMELQPIVMLDRPDDLTKSLVLSRADVANNFQIVDFGDLGLTRNEAVKLSQGQYITFFDGDDLWGKEWIWRAFNFMQENSNGNEILHPEVIYYFSADDYLKQSRDDRPSDGLTGYYFLHKDSTSMEFNSRDLVLNNYWTANSFSSKSVYEANPYLAVDRSNGFGVEDWTWNVATCSRGLNHRVVPGTVHCIRLKNEGSLGKENMAEGLLPPVGNYFKALTSY